MTTAPARFARTVLAELDDTVTAAELRALGCTDSRRRANLAAGRWRQVGRAVVLHSGPLTRAEQWRVGVLNCGPRAVLASFSAAESLGLEGWERAEIHVLAPVGVRPPRLPGLTVVLHRTRRDVDALAARPVQRIAPALVLAASSFATARPACGILAAGVQQRLTSAGALRAAVAAAPRIRHRAALIAAVEDIAMGAHALSEIDFARLCRRHGLPEPVRQQVRRDPSGRRRYLDALWVLPDGRRVVVEVDGALHVQVLRWYADQLRQNEVSLRGSLVLRFPSVVVRTEEAVVVDQLGRALGVTPRS
jgi:hypothetical protein